MSRRNVLINGPQGDVPELPAFPTESFGAAIHSDVPIVVERSVYTDLDGVPWASGANATAAAWMRTPPPPPPIPIAIAGPDQTDVLTNEIVTLDGSASHVRNDAFATVEYRWSLVAKPAGSNATLVGATSARPTFVADVSGEYIVQLLALTPLFQSAPDTVVVTAAQ